VDTWLPVVFPVVLFAVVAWLMASHLRARQHDHEADDGQDRRESDFRRRQFRRRVQTTGMLGLVALALALGHWITIDRVSPTVFAVYWSGVVLLVLWVLLLAMADVLSTKQHFGRIERTHQVEKARLEAQLREIQAAEGNGHPPEDATE